MRAAAEGVAISFVANSSTETDTTTSYGTTKVAAFLAHGYFVRCADTSSGLRETFARVAGHLFDTMKLKDSDDAPVVFAIGHEERTGDRTTGYRYTSVSRRPSPDTGYLEWGSSFSLKADEKTWEVLDFTMVTERDTKGSVQQMAEYASQDGTALFEISAKISEDKKFRLKLDAGGKTSALEKFPKAPLNTELGAAPELLRVGSGKAPSYRYAFLGVADGDPTFVYDTLTHSGPGVVLESEDDFASGAKRAAPKSKNELQLEAHGLVKKGILTDSVYELVHTWGTLPVAGDRTASGR
jgi:hypothetical protein